MAHRQHVELVAWYDLPVALAVSSSCAGRRFRIQVGSTDALMWLPQLRWSDDRPYVVAPDLQTAVRERIGRHRLQEDELFGDSWGEVTTWNARTKRTGGLHVSTVAISCAVARRDLDYSEYLYGLGHPQGDLIDELFHTVDDWFDCLRTWIEVTRGQDLDYLYPLKSLHVPGNGLQVLTMDADEVSLPARPQHMTITSRTVRPVAPALLRRLLRRASIQQMPSPAHLLLRDARAALNRRHYRRAAIDAGSALEVALADFNRVQVQVPPPTKPTLGWYVGNAVLAARAVLPPDTKTAVVVVRNDAIHNNLTPSLAQAQEAIEIVSSVLDRLDPVP